MTHESDIYWAVKSAIISVDPEKGPPMYPGGEPEPSGITAVLKYERQALHIAQAIWDGGEEPTVERVRFEFQALPETAVQELTRAIRDKVRWVEVLARHGIRPHDLWNLSHRIAAFVAPRLRFFRDMPRDSVPIDREAPESVPPRGLDGRVWEQRLESMIEAFDLLAEDGPVEDYEQAQRIKQGLRLFADHLEDLWD